MQWVALIICLVVILIGAVVSLVRCLRDDDCRREKPPPPPEPPQVQYATVEPQDRYWRSIYSTAKSANVKSMKGV